MLGRGLGGDGKEHLLGTYSLNGYWVTEQH